MKKDPDFRQTAGVGEGIDCYHKKNYTYRVVCTAFSAICRGRKAIAKKPEKNPKKSLKNAKKVLTSRE